MRSRWVSAALLFVLAGCGESWRNIHSREQARISAALDLCRYSAVDTKTGKVLCEEGDCDCHANLTRTLFWGRKEAQP